MLRQFRYTEARSLVTFKRTGNVHLLLSCSKAIEIMADLMPPSLRRILLTDVVKKHEGNALGKFLTDEAKAVPFMDALTSSEDARVHLCLEGGYLAMLVDFGAHRRAPRTHRLRVMISFSPECAGRIAIVGFDSWRPTFRIPR